MTAVWCFPPRAVIGRAVQHAREVAAHGTLVLPCWPGALWWPWVDVGAPGVIAHWRMPATRGLVQYAGRAVTLSEDLLLVRFDFR